MSYKEEFSPEFNLGFNLSDFPRLVDKSWHNDTCPSFYFTHADQNYVLWIEDADPDMREFTEHLRYTVFFAKFYGDKIGDDEVISDYDKGEVLSTDSTEEIIAFLYEKQVNMPVIA